MCAGALDLVLEQVADTETEKRTNCSHGGRKGEDSSQFSQEKPIVNFYETNYASCGCFGFPPRAKELPIRTRNNERLNTA